MDTPSPARASTKVAICIQGAGPRSEASSRTSIVRGPRAAAPFRTAPLRAAPFRSLAAVPLGFAVPLRTALPPLAAVPPLAAPAWAPVRALRARLDFEAVIASFASGDFTGWSCTRSTGTQRGRHLAHDCTPRV